MAILKVICIKDINPKLVTMKWFLEEGVPTEVPKEGGVYSSDGYWHHPEYGWYIHLLEFPHKDAGWNAYKFVMEANPNINVEYFLNEVYRDQIIPAQGYEDDLQAN
jgi:hypothetical protein